MNRVNHMRERGFSMVELMIVVAITGILMALAMPAYRDFINRQQMQAAALEFYAAVNLTRAEAIKRGDQVTMAAADGADWKSGWTIFLDANNNLRRDSGEQIIMTHDALPATLAVASAFTDATAPYISYTGNGRSRTKASVFQPQAGTVSFTAVNMTRRIKVNFLGRARMCDPDKDLTCDATASGG
ncbi:GspH/FimT family pseudopilin [Undibacterium squillarum]|nr:GspH/FimT family pseudopilin [Undibacterium squillarum]